MSTQKVILTKITDKISNVHHLEIKDVTSDHADHLPDNSKDTHFDLIIVSDIFSKMNLLERHRYIYEILKPELINDIHALSLILLTIKEYKNEI